jgi:hypothetical protein
MERTMKRPSKKESRGPGANKERTLREAKGRGAPAKRSENTAPLGLQASRAAGPARLLALLAMNERMKARRKCLQTIARDLELQPGRMAKILSRVWRVCGPV